MFVQSEQFQFNFDLISCKFYEVDMYFVSPIYLFGKAGEGGGMGVDSINTVFHHLEAAE